MLRFRIANMTCGGCAKGVAATLREVDPAMEPQFDLERREVTLPVTANGARFASALAEAGWQAETLPG